MKSQIVQTRMMVNRNGEEQEIYIDGYVSYSIDKFYGQDAGGGHAESRTFVEDVTDITAWGVFGEDVLLDAKEREQAERLLGEQFLNG